MSTITEPLKIELQNSHYLIPFDQTARVLDIAGTECHLIERQSLVNMAQENAELRKERDLCEQAIMSICLLLGLTTPDGKHIRPEIISGDEGYMSGLMKAGADLFLLFSKTNIPGGIGRRAEEQVKEKFAFLEKIQPILKKYTQ